MTVIMAQHQLELKEFSYKELSTPEGLARLDYKFLAYLKKQDIDLYQDLLNYRQGLLTSPLEISELIIACGPCLEAFISHLFSIENSVNDLNKETLSHNPIFNFKKIFVLKYAKRQLSQADKNLDFLKLDQNLDKDLILAGFNSSDRESSIAWYGLSLLEDESRFQLQIQELIDWCVAAIVTTEGQHLIANWEMFKFPQKLDFANLVSIQPVNNDPYGRYESPHLRQREGFDLTDSRMTKRQVMNHVHYCIYCHDKEGDFCSKGFPVKKNEPSLGLKINPVSEILTGCPLEEKISEMHVLKKNGHDIAALATIMIDNPMCPATGHRICNDCMKACIYQKQEPVNIPETETRILTDVLNLPWGVEIYLLLTRWNPLRSSQWSLKPYNGLKVLVMGMGPAGFTLAHHLLMEGYAVVGMDGLKIEPLADKWINEPIHSWQALQENLSDRLMAGFGGVAEYGITVRWDKNFLKLIYLCLMRHHYFQLFGSVRFGGTLTVEDAWRLGFDHLAVAVGAGLPKELAIPNSLAPGMRQANDFLMALQLSGAAKEKSLANLQVRLPAVIIGGGLTGVDTATEVQAYYFKQIEKVAKRYHQLIKQDGIDLIRSQFNNRNLEILDEFLLHESQLQKERNLAQIENREVDYIKLIRTWGGVTIAYRKAMTESPAYCRNPEELTKALEEGIYYAEGLEPVEALLDEFGQVRALKFSWRIYDEEGNWKQTDEQQVLPARSVFVATGARLNVAYEFEHRGTFQRRHSFEYQTYEVVEQQLKAINNPTHVKASPFGPFTSYQEQNKKVTFIGDTHPLFHGSVVKAIASAKRTYPLICSSLSQINKIADKGEYDQFRSALENLFECTLVSIHQISPQLFEVIIKAPFAAAKFEGGQFYRIQNYESHSVIKRNTQFQMEALALLGIKHFENPDYLVFLVMERGVSSRLLKQLKSDQPLALMGPTGANINFNEEENNTILLVGGLMAAIFLLSLLSSLNKGQQPKIIFIACFEPEVLGPYREQIESLTETLWVKGKESEKNWIDELLSYQKAPSRKVALLDISKIFLIGSTQLLAVFKENWFVNLQSHFNPGVKVLGSVYGPMQCMLKGVCAQCLQWQVNPETGERTKAVYACSWQHQPLPKIDINHIDQRLEQNQTQEILTSLWFDYIQQPLTMNL